MIDIVPDLLGLINQKFDERTVQSKVLKDAIRQLKESKATYINANNFAIEVGEILSGILGETITPEALPDGRMYYNIADRILNPTLKKNYDLISGYAADVQNTLNKKADLHLRAQTADINQDRIDSIINRISSESDFDKIKWILGDPVVNFSQSVVDDVIDKNAEFQAKAGLQPTITRSLRGKACEWCRNLAGTYDYDKRPADIFRRHENCRCTVEFDPKDSRGIQNSHTKVWHDPDKSDKIEARKNIGLEPDGKKITKTKHSRIRQSQREVTDNDINLALKNPIHKEPVAIDDLGRKSQKVIGEYTTVVINPDNMIVITTYKTKERIRNKYKKGDI